MVTQITSDAMVSGLEQQQAVGGKLRGKRQLLSVTVIGVLLLSLGALAAIATVHLRPDSRAVNAPAPIAVSAPWTGACRTGSAGCEPDEGFVPVSDSPAMNSGQQAQLRQIHARDNGPVVVPSTRRSPQFGPAWFDVRDYPQLAGAAGTAGLGTGVGVIEYLPGEQPSTGHGTPSGNSGPCLPLQLCPR